MEVACFPPLHLGDNRKSQRVERGSAVIYSINGERKRPPLNNPPAGRHQPKTHTLSHTIYNKEDHDPSYFACLD